MSELALAAFTARDDAPAVASPADRGFAAFARTFDVAAYERALAESNLRWLPRSSPEFPPLLAAIHDPPPGLFVRGEGLLSLLVRPAVAVVGARACSGYGRAVARMLGLELGRAGALVVSGLARGVDGYAHRGALEAAAPTVAVLGCGIDRVYPAAHRELAAAIARTGLVVSEYPPGVDPAPWRFPARNRIVAGLCAATVVVEARERSGALITADFALEEGRDVFSVPGEITAALSAGTNALLRAGAVPLVASGDVLASLGLEPQLPQRPALRADAERILAAVTAAPATADEVCRHSGLDAGAVAVALAELELEGLVVEADGVFRGGIRVR